MKSHATYAGDPRHHATDLAELRAENKLLRDALVEFHEFVTEHLDPDPHPIEAYLCWRQDRVAELRRVLGKRQ